MDLNLKDLCLACDYKFESSHLLSPRFLLYSRKASGVRVILEAFYRLGAGKSLDVYVFLLPFVTWNNFIKISEDFKKCSVSILNILFFIANHLC